MILIFINSKSTKFSQITLRVKRFIHKIKVVPFFCLTVCKEVYHHDKYQLSQMYPRCITCIVLYTPSWTRSLMSNSHRPPDTTKQSGLRRVWRGGVN